MARVATSLGAKLIWPAPGVWLGLGLAAGGGGVGGWRWGCRGRKEKRKTSWVEITLRLAQAPITPYL